MCQYFFKNCFLTSLLLVKSLTHQGKRGGNDYLAVVLDVSVCVRLVVVVHNLCCLKTALRWKLPAKFS